MRKLFAAFVLSACAFIAVSAQSRVVVSAEGEFGAFGLHGVPHAKLGSGKAIGASLEAAREFTAGSTVIVPKALVSIKRVMPDGGENYTNVGLRPEVEAHLPISEDLKAILGAGFQYNEGNRNHQFNPTVSAGVKYYGIEATVARLFPDRENGNARGWRYNTTYHAKNFFGEGLSSRSSVELFKGRSELEYAPMHPGYAGYVLTFRTGISWDK